MGILDEAKKDFEDSGLNLDNLKKLKDEGTEESKQKLKDIAQKVGVSTDDSDSHESLFEKISRKL